MRVLHTDGVLETESGNLLASMVFPRENIINRWSGEDVDDFGFEPQVVCWTARGICEKWWKNTWQL